MFSLCSKAQSDLANALTGIFEKAEIKRFRTFT